MRDPVSWMVVEGGWSVVARGGEELGTVEEVLGDTETDIFDGLTVSQGRLRRPRYVPAEVVRNIYVELVELDLTTEQFARLPKYAGSAPSSDVLAELLQSLARARD